MSTSSSATSVLDEVTTWPGVSIQLTPRDSTPVLVNGHELGHVHPTAARSTCHSQRPDARRY
jgi:Family of unknown function (DUF5519)